MIRWHKVRTIAQFEFLAVAKRTGFLVVTFGMPLFMAAYVAVLGVPAYYSARQERAPVVYGVVDQAKLLRLQDDVAGAPPVLNEQVKQALEATGQSAAVNRAVPQSRFVFRAIADEPQARALLAARSLGGYFVLTAGYVETGLVDVYLTDTLNSSGSDARNAFGTLVREQLVRGHMAPDLAARVITPLANTRRFAVTRTGEVKDGGGVSSALRFGLPLAFMVMFLMSVIMSSGYLVQGTATEKENKVVEVLLASANPDEIMAGKLVGLGAAGLIQVGVWTTMLFLTGFGALPMILGSDVDVPWRALAYALPFFLAGFLFFGSLMLGSGSLGASMREAQQMSMIWTLMAALPMIMMGVLIREPHGLTSRILTWLPVTSGPVVIMRASIDPDYLVWWEVAGALVLLLLATWGALRMGARLFRVGLLNSGARPTMREVWRQARLES